MDSPTVSMLGPGQVAARCRARCLIGRGFSARSCRATFGTTSLSTGFNIDDVQEAFGHADAVCRFDCAMSSKSSDRLISLNRVAH